MAQQKTEPIPIPIQNFELGGLADSRWSGMKNTMAKLVGIDLHTIPGVVQARQKLTKDSGETVDEFCKYQLKDKTTGDSYHFSSESGKVWKRTVAGVWSLVYTMTAEVGEVKILGAKEYNGYFYIATELRLHRIAISGLDDWDTNMVLNWDTFTNGSKVSHPMLNHVQQAVLYIGDSSLVAQVEGDTFTPDALDVRASQNVTTLGPFINDILVGTDVGDVYRWNGASVSWTGSAHVDDGAINCILPSTNYTLIQAGKAGRFFYYQITANGDQLVDYKKIPGVYGPNNYMMMYPDAGGNLMGLILAGVSNGSGNPCDQGIYCFGRYAANYPTTLDLSFPISERSDEEDDTSIILNNVEIGSILVDEFDVFVSWRLTNGEMVKVGIDILDWENKLNGAYMQTRVMVIDRANHNNFCDFEVATASLPEDCNVIVTTRVNYEDDPDTGEELFRDVQARVDYGNKLIGISKVVPANTMELKYKFITSGNDSPMVESAAASIKPNG